MTDNQPPEPWLSFLAELDEALRQEAVLHCLGGFTLAMLYGMARPTVDVDFVMVAPTSEGLVIESLGGKGSTLHLKYGVYMQRVAVVTLPESYPERLTPIFPGIFGRLHLMGLESHDLALSKLERNSARDREDIRYLARSASLDPETLTSRYYLELRPYLSHVERHDLTLRLWLEMLACG